jgi:hypothetical protein
MPRVMEVLVPGQEVQSDQISLVVQPDQDSTTHSSEPARTEKQRAYRQSQTISTKKCCNQPFGDVDTPLMHLQGTTCKQVIKHSRSQTTRDNKHTHQTLATELGQSAVGRQQKQTSHLIHTLGNGSKHPEPKHPKQWRRPRILQHTNLRKQAALQDAHT